MTPRIWPLGLRYSRWQFAIGTVVALCCAASLRADDYTPVQDLQLVEIGRGFAVTQKLHIDDQVRIRVVEKGDGIGDAIELAAYDQAQIKRINQSESGDLLEDWPADELEAGQVLTWKLEEPAFIGIRMVGSSNARREVQRAGDHFRMTFHSISHRWVLDVKFMRPAF